MRIYLTHCSKDKSLIAKASGEKLPPDLLYTDTGLQEFIATCRSSGADWAILSDQYGVFFPTEQHTYYEKPPVNVTPEEELVIIRQFDQTLTAYDEIWFFVRAETFHLFYDRVLKSSSLHNRITLFFDLNAIKG
jgi:hypothetical protein